MEAPEFIPDLSLEKDRLVVVEHVLGEDGLIDRHLAWVATADSPTKDLTDKQYGYLPEGKEGLRPSNEPVDFREVCSQVLGIAYDTPHGKLTELVNDVDEGWFEFLAAQGVLDSRQIKAMIDVANRAYRVNTNTEDNDPAYVSAMFGNFLAHSRKYGIDIPAVLEWSRGIWPKEEDAHKMSMNQYGDMRDILTSREHVASRNSQLWAGMDQNASHIIKIFAYTAWQELSTHMAHKRDGDLFGPVGNRLLMDIASDESRHHNVYTTILKAFIDNPEFADDAIRTLRSIMTPPSEMPGAKGITYFSEHAAKIHMAGLFGIEQAYEAARQVMIRLGLLPDKEGSLKEIQGLSTEGHAALAEIRTFYEERKIEARHGGRFILGVTIDSASLRTERKNYADSIGLPQKAAA